MKKKIPTFKTDAEAEDFLENADLSAYDLSGLRPVRFEFLPKDKTVNLRMPESLLDAVKSRAKGEGMSYQKYIRHVLERDLLSH